MGMQEGDKRCNIAKRNDRLIHRNQIKKMMASPRQKEDAAKPIKMHFGI